MVLLEPTQCAVSIGKCSHLFSNSSGEDGAAAGSEPRPLAQAGAAVPGNTLHSAKPLSLPCPNDWFPKPRPWILKILMLCLSGIKLKNRHGGRDFTFFFSLTKWNCCFFNQDHYRKYCQSIHFTPRQCSKIQLSQFRAGAW